MPDGFDARVKVMTKKEVRIEIDELGHATMSYEYYENEGTKKGISLAANVVHSIDAYIMRSMHRRCNYNHEVMEQASLLIEAEMLRRILGGEEVEILDVEGKVSYYIDQYERSGMADVVIAPWLDSLNVVGLSKEHLEKLAEVINSMLEYQPFELVGIHDAFLTHANNCNYLRQQYINILAELADSNIMSDIMSQLLGEPVVYQKLSNNLSVLIKESNYGLS
jgi:hypothetical protein